MREFDSHLDSHGEKHKVFKRVQECFLSTIPINNRIRHQTLRVKTLRDKLRTILVVLKSNNNSNIAASSISKLVSEEGLLGGFLLEIEEHKIQAKSKTEKLSQSEKKLVRAREKIEQLELSRLSRNTKNLHRLRKRTIMETIMTRLTGWK